MFQYLMKLHYSQTSSEYLIIGLLVSVPYEITLLSNRTAPITPRNKVSVPYEITLLSNIRYLLTIVNKVSVP